MKNKLFENKKSKVFENPLFFGGVKNTQRYDKNRFNSLSKLSMDMQKLFWIPEEIKLQKDKIDFSVSSEVEKHILKTQLSKLVMLDSLQGRSPILMFSQISSNPEFEAALLEQTYFEARIHSRSYSYIIEEMFKKNEVDGIFDKIWEIDEMREEIDTITEEYESLYSNVIDYLNKKDNEIEITEEYMKDLKEKIFLSIVSMNILEGIRFYVGFVSIWSITEFHQKFFGVSKILQLIARDETQHLRFTQTLIKLLKRDEAFKGIFEKITPKIYDMYFQASEEEIRWSKELLKFGNIMGINEEILETFVKYLTNIRLKSIGLKPIYPEVKSNPVKWIKNWINLSITEKALQETEEIDYLSNAISGEINKLLFKDL